jgi:hypothetical protein
MKNPIRTNLTLVRVLALAAMSLLPCSASAQSTGGGFDVLGVIRSLDPESRMLTVDALGEEHLVKVLGAARILDAEGQALPKGLESLALVNGTVVTLTLGSVSGDLAVNVLRLGEHVPDQEPIRGPTLGLKPLTEMSASDRYKDEDGGLYGGGRNEPPASHLAAAKLANGRITPMNADGEPASDGKRIES